MAADIFQNHEPGLSGHHAGTDLNESHKVFKYLDDICIRHLDQVSENYFDKPRKVRKSEGMDVRTKPGLFCYPEGAK